MDETLVADIHADMYHTFLAFRRRLAPEENQIARLEVTEIRSNIDMLAHVCLLGSIPRNDDVVHEKNGAHEAATIHPFGGSASPKIRDAHHAMRRGYNAGGILLQGGTPFLLRHGDGFGDISLTAVGISHLIKGTFCPLPLQAVSGSNIRDGLRCLAGL